jgi:hypothetical protein
VRWCGETVVTLPQLWAELSREDAQRSPTRKKAVAYRGETGKKEVNTW